MQIIFQKLRNKLLIMFLPSDKMQFFVVSLKQ